MVRLSYELICERYEKAQKDKSDLRTQISNLNKQLKSKEKRIKSLNLELINQRAELKKELRETKLLLGAVLERDKNE